MGKKSKKYKKKKKYQKKKYGNKHGKGRHGHKKKKMGLGKKLLIGAGIAVVAVGALYIGKKMYDQHKKDQRQKLAYQQQGGGSVGGHDKRDLVDDGPAPPQLAKYLANADVNKYTNSMDTIPIPDALTVGLGWDSDNRTDYDLVAAAYDASGTSLGYIQGAKDMMSLFNKAITHTGDNDGTSDVDTVLGDSENIVFDLRSVPSSCTQILFGATLVTPPENIQYSKPYLHMLPLIRPEVVESQKAAGGTREIQDDSDSDSDSDDDTSHSSPSYGTRGVTDDGLEEDNRHDFVTLFHSELIQYPEMLSQRAFVGGKIFRAGSEWMFTPYRTVVQMDPQYGIWPAFDHYAKLQSQQPAQQYGYPQQQQQQYTSPPQLGYQQPPQQYGYPQEQQQYTSPPASGYGYYPQQPGYY